jgi:hypothetical protein
MERQKRDGSSMRKNLIRESCRCQRDRTLQRHLDHMEEHACHQNRMRSRQGWSECRTEALNLHGVVQVPVQALKLRKVDYLQEFLRRQEG